MTRAWAVQNRKEPSTFVKIQSEHRQVISNKFLKSFRSARDLVAFYELFCDFPGVFRLSKTHQAPPSHEHP